MIPQKLILEGFLCYRTPQEIDLGDLPLCMLAGPNGSGKSTVFDAITFALFGTHRAGASNAGDLINKKCDAATIVYEFLLDGSPWRIYKTIRRSPRSTRVTGDVRRPSGKGDGQQWEVVPDTSSAAGLDNWVASKLHINSEAFTRSMLLRQGESDRLLSAKPAERFEVLAGIAELDKYRDLEARAIRRRNSTSEEAENLASQLDSIVPVSGEQLAQAVSETVAAGDRVSRADEQTGVLVEHQAKATHWADLKVKMDQAEGNRQDAQSLIANAAQIEADHAQLTILTGVLPELEKILSRRGNIAASCKRIHAHTEQRSQKQTALDNLALQSRESLEICTASEPLLPELEAHLGTLAGKIAESRRALDTTERTEGLRKSLNDANEGIHRIVKKHPHPEVELGNTRQELERLTALHAALPTLERFMESRKNGGEASARRDKAAVDLQNCRTDADTVAAECKAADRDLATLETSLKQAQFSETEAHTLLEQANAAMSALDDADGKPQCPTCGQPLTESHLAKERQRRAYEVARLAAAKAAATAGRQTSESRLAELRRASSVLQKRQQQLAGRLDQLDASIAHAGQEIVRLGRECRRAYDALPEDLRMQISPNIVEDWALTIWPAEPDLDKLHLEARQRVAAQERVKLLEKVCAEWRDLKAKAETVRGALAGQDIATAENLTALRNAHAHLEKQHAQATTRLADTRESLRVHRQSLKRLSDQIKLTEAEIIKLDGLCDIELACQKNDDQAVTEIISALPADWTSRVEELSSDSMKRWNLQAADLRQRGVAEAMKALANARAVLAGIDARISELTTDISRIPEASRQSPELLAQQLQQARATRIQLEKDRQQAQTRHDQQQLARSRRLELEQSKRDADRRLRHLKVLCELLGKKQLQLHLVRQTERRIVECANIILSTLSAGDLRLQLRGDDSSDVADQALDLIATARQTAGGDPHAVAFLSGSQRFRVAVSLALAIGQVAGNNRCGECVIIDEGFGSLDRQGQDVMIQELKHLQGIMKRIILVSHQESFADAFPHGYRFSIENGEARAQRMSG